MSPLSLIRHALLVALVFVALSNWSAEARYLPTRSQDDRLERLRELIKDLLDTELEKPANTVNNNELFERKLLYKREAGGQDAGAVETAAAVSSSSSSSSHSRTEAGDSSTHPRTH